MTPQTQTIQALCELLEQGDEVDRCYSAKALSSFGDQSAIDALIPRLKDEDIDVCVDAAVALGSIGDTRAAPALIESLENEPNGEICSVVAEALGKIGDSSALAALRKIALERPEEMEWEDDWDMWWDVQLEAVKGLGIMEDTQAIETLTQILDSEEHQDIENQILAAMVNIGDNGTELTIERLQNEEHFPQHRRRAAKALSKSTDKQAAKALGRALGDDSWEVRSESAKSLATLGADQYLPALLLMLRDSNEEVRNAAFKSILVLSEKGIACDALQRDLTKLLADPGSQVRASLMQTLSTIQEKHFLTESQIEQVVESLNDSSAETASAACHLLGSNGDPSAIPALLATLEKHSGHPMTRRESALAIGKLGQITPEVMDSLTRAVGDSQQPVRLAALSALMHLELQGENLHPDQREDEPLPPTPLEVIISAVNGEIVLTESQNSTVEQTDKREILGGAASPSVLREAQFSAEGKLEQSQLEPEVEAVDTETSKAETQTAEQQVKFDPEAFKNEDKPTPEPLPEEFSDYIQLPESPAQIVQEGEVKPALSTLEAIALENVETVLRNSSPAPEVEHDEETESYLEVVKENKEMMRRIRANRKIKAEDDVRRLGAHILAKSSSEIAIRTLINALSEDDATLRLEAAAALGQIAIGNRDIPQLMDSVGTLITQLAISELENRVVCARTLGNLGNRAALAPLMEALNDKEINVRVQAIASLAQLVVEGSDPGEADHMVVRDVPPLSVAKKILGQLDDDNLAIRVAAARGLGTLLPSLGDRTFISNVLKKLIDAAAALTGEESRTIGKILRRIDIPQSTDILLSRMKQTEESARRGIYIEMLEELLKPLPEETGRAA
ncbi:MAG: hypothetical protein GY696_06475 [Gammaproteobacteria bacterium]|nr:hypothetical protein [Gammaproteobacteria bacterium]